MKKILIVSLGMEIGGAEKSLLTMLSELDYQKVKVELFLLHKKGELLKYIPEQVTVLEESPFYSQLAIPIMNVIKNGKWNIASGRLLAKICAKIYNRMHFPGTESYVELEYSHKYTKKYMPQISNNIYDLVISYLTPHYFAAEKTIGKKKLAWVHTDYAYINCNVKSEIKMWNRYDYIVAISDAVRESFIEKFPTLRSKVIMIENTVSRKFVLQQANAFDASNELNQNSFNLLSIGRFCYPKNFDSIPAICSNLLKNGYQIKWYIIGFGLDEGLIRAKIVEYEMEDTVIILGKKTNPYPYIKACDIYVQPSRYEGKAISVLEAQALNKPVVITNYGTSSGQLQNGYNGLIVSMEIQKCAKEIGELIEDLELQRKLSKGCEQMNFPNDYDVLYDLCEEKI